MSTIPPHRRPPAKAGTARQVRRFAGFLRDEVAKLQSQALASVADWERFVHDHPELLKLSVRHAAEVVIARHREWRPPLRRHATGQTDPTTHETILYDIGGRVSPEPKPGAICLGVWCAPCPLHSATWSGPNQLVQPGFRIDGKVCPVVQIGDRMHIVIEGPDDAPTKSIVLKRAR